MGRRCLCSSLVFDESKRVRLGPERGPVHPRCKRISAVRIGLTGGGAYQSRV